jgi:hypothetical protein
MVSHQPPETPTDQSTEKPIDRVLARINAKRYSKGYLAHCPAHRDTQESLAIWEDQTDEHVGIKCYAGCTRKAIVEAIGLTEQDLYQRDRPRAIHQNEPGITLLDLAIAKRIHPNVLVNLDLVDITYRGRSAVRIPYRLPDGSLHSRARIRCALVAKEGSTWSKGDAAIIPYGLHRLEEARKAGYLILVEGESDCWTLWSYGYPALGIPGAALSTCLDPSYFEGIDRLYVVQEPDKAGMALPGNVRSHLQKFGFTGTVFALNLKASSDAKDPNDLHQVCVEADRFKALFRQALDSAQDLALIPASAPPKGSGSDTTGTGTPQDGRVLPEVIVNNVQLRDMVNEAITAIMLRERENPTLFMQASRLVRVGRDEKQRPVIVQMGVSEVKEVLTHSANFYRRLKKSSEEEGEDVLISVSPPKEIAEQILARQAQSPYLPFPALDTIVETPVLRPDGSILDTPGYDKQTRLYYVLTSGMEECLVPENPTPEEREAALALIWQAFGEFPYAGEADRANALALLLTPIVRPAIKRHVPMALADAPKRGTGKGLLCDGVTIVAAGDTAPILTMSENADELQKSITALLMEGATIIIIDNITERLQSKHLDAVLTSDIWRSRILGASKMTRVPQRATWIATGNNIRLGGDLPRRCYRIRLDAKMSRPDKRRDFTIRDLATWIKEHRAELVRALLILARAWYVAGKPQDEDLPAMATFTGWVRTVGGILKHAGVRGFLANLDQLQEQNDEESAQWEAFLLTWLERFGDAWVTTADICTVLTQTNELAGVVDDLAGVENKNEPNSLFDALPEWLQVALKEKPKSFKVSLGKALEKRVDACFGEENVRLEKTKTAHRKTTVWRVNRSLAGVGRGVSGSCEHENSEFINQSINKKANDSGNRWINPCQPLPNDETAESQKMPTGLTGGLTDNGDPSDLPKTGEFGSFSETTPANPEEREVFTL